MQSTPVSPPPMTMTSLLRAERGRWSMSLPICFFCQVSRKLMAKWIPSSHKCRIVSSPGMGRSLGQVEPVVNRMASKRARSSLPATSLPTSVDVTKLTPSCAIRSTRRCTT
ncbi:unnamed protein product, partial [Ixodes pacificus]